MMKSASVTMEGRWLYTDEVPPELIKPKVPMKFRYENSGLVVEGEFIRRRTLRKRGIIRLYGSDTAGKRVTCDIAFRVATH